MTFLQHTSSLPATVVHHTGTMVRFTSGQLAQLPDGDGPVLIDLPDGTVAQGHFRCHPANPYLAGRDIVQWIKGWLPMGENHAAVIHQVGQASRVRLTLIGPTHVVTPASSSIHRAAKRLGAGLTSSPAHRRRALLEAWERNPLLRAFVLDRWGSQCQVDGCTIQGEVPAHLAHSIVDVHHLTHVSGGGSDSPMNLSVLCTAHHALVHRSKSKLIDADGRSARIQVNGNQLLVRRDVPLLMVP